MNYKVIYYCRRSISTHFHINKSWVKHAYEKDVDIELFATCSQQDFQMVKSEVDPRFMKVSPINRYLETLLFILYLVKNSLKYPVVLLHLKKRSPGLSFLIRTFCRNVKVLIEREGDFQFEYEFLRRNPYKNGFYDDILRGYKKNLLRDSAEIRKSDAVISVSPQLSAVLSKRYQVPIEKFIDITTGVDEDRFRYDSDSRKEARESLGLSGSYAMIYVGNILYSWQNIARVLDCYKIAKKLHHSAALTIITRKADQNILREMLERKDLDRDSEIRPYFSLKNSEIPKFLHASDLAVILRDNDPMNHVASPGKFGEYACAGVPIITGRGISNFSEKLQKENLGYVLQDIHDKQEIEKMLQLAISELADFDRVRLSEWGSKEFSYSSFIDSYVKGLNKVAGLIPRSVQ